jgi:hypothetical protein
MSLFKKLSNDCNVSSEAYGIEDVFVNFNTLESAKNPDKKPMYRFEYDGHGDAEAINKELIKIFGEPSLMQEDPGDRTYYNEYVDESSYVRIYFNGVKDKDLQLRGATVDFSVFERIKQLAITTIERIKPSNSVFALMSGRDGLSLRPIGQINHDIVNANYTKDAMEGYQHVVECLSSSDPCGRLILLQGPPGTGKSYMIRSLVSSVNSTFIVVGAHMIAELSGPAILPVLTQFIDPDDKKPITFILEDSDIALSDRNKGGGVAELSGLLNLGDGLLGELLDIRVLATTNAKMLDMDPAVVRPGRMCQHIKLDPFGAKEATALHAGMVKEQMTTFKKDTTLAEIYRAAREDGWVPKVTKKPDAGQYL